MKTSEIELGGLSCRMVDALMPGQEPRLSVVLCHGFGAPATDLVPIGSQLILIQPAIADSVRFIFPAAPLLLDGYGLPGGRAWWMVDVAELATAIEQGQLRNPSSDPPADLLQARQALTSLVEEVIDLCGTPLEQIVLGGFSQGSILATDVALRLPVPPAALCIWSGTLVAEDQWRPLAAQKSHLPVLQSHGRQDPLLPYSASLWLRDMLIAEGIDVDFVDFDGGHTIPPLALQKFTVMLETLVENGQPPRNR